MTADSALYLAHGDYEALAVACEQTIEADPEALVNYWYLGLARLLQGDEAEAQTVWVAAAGAVEPSALEAGMVELIHLLETEVDRQLAQGRPDLAERVCWQLVEIDSEHASYYLKLGQCLALQAHYEAAIDHWQTALTLQPCAMAYQKQGEVFQALVQWDEAIAAYNKAIELQPSWETHYQLGVCLGQQKRWQDALAHLDRVIQLHPLETAAYGDRGWALLQMGHWQEAVAEFKRAILSSTVAMAQTDGGAEGLSDSARSSITIRNARFFHALHALCFRSESERSELNVNDSESNHPELAVVCWTLGQVLAENSQWERAIEAYRFALQHHPSAEIWTALGKVLALSEPQAAIEAYETALRDQPNFAEARLRLGQLLVLKNRERAVQLFQTAVQLQPGAEGYVLLARWATEDLQEKIALYRQALTLQPDRIDALLHLSYALAETGDLQGAIAGFQHALWLQPSLYKTICAALEVFVQEGQEQTNRFAHILSLAEAPTGYYETTQEWATQASEASSYLALDPPHLIELTLPQGIARETHVSFRFGRAIQLPETFVVALPKGQFWLNPAQTSSAILTADHQLLGDLSPEFPILSPGHPDKQPGFHSLLQVEHRSPIQKLEGTIAVLSGLTNQMYFHWMFDVLPRFYLLKRAEMDLSQIDGFVVSANLPFQQETLCTLEIPNSKILETNQYSHLQADRLIVPSYPGSPAWMPKWACEWLRSVFLKNHSNSGDNRLYISRQDAANRRVLNEPELMEWLTLLGFQCITLEGRSVQEQANLFATASVIISPHGGGLTNTVFCRPGTKVIELFAPNYVYPCYWLVSNLLNLDYYYLTGKTLGQFLTASLYPDARLADIWIDREELQTLLKRAKVIG